MLIGTALKRGFQSFFIAIGVSHLVNISISIVEGNGHYLSTMPRFAALFPNELTAYIVQAVFIGLMGAVFAASSVFFMIEKWSFLRQCVAHFLTTSIVWTAVVLLVWMPFGESGMWIVLGSFVVTYLSVWLTQIIINRRIARRINARLDAASKGDSK